MLMRKLSLPVVAAALATVIFAPQVQAGDAAAGQKVFNKCRACHVADKETNRVGPHLVGIIGRKTASVDGFKYSDGMKAAGEKGLVWTEENFTKYMKDPKDFVPGNRMAFVGLKSDKEIEDLIAFLKK
ncbi:MULTISPECIES: c-type cytochrome [Oceanibaculum]|uniref:Cytochrome C class I n=1 Tax=Oceanibaculum indicum P24 TaxID=1207063 RepID=K2JK07_9PROT|nr:MULTISPECIES: cytochrome c family protein [Oceanibaculum]EKE74772.1 cytochrome C class I [Oceanibaculum indicum P24]MCH2393276.1 cytochrome c family protein [Oceanibaculum sp.]